MKPEIEELLEKLPMSKLKKINLLATIGLKTDGAEVKHFFLLQILKILNPEEKED